MTTSGATRTGSWSWPSASSRRSWSGRERPGTNGEVAVGSVDARMTGRAPRIAVFGPDPLLTVAIERRADGGDELHLHAGGQGVWVARIARELGGDPVLCGFAG